jgi:hypothetical protein
MDAAKSPNTVDDFCWHCGSVPDKKNADPPKHYGFLSASVSVVAIIIFNYI